MNQQRILLIDDQSGITRLLCLALQRTGRYIVREENDSTRALATALEFNPAVIFCDIDMPKLDGGEVARRIRGHAALSHVPIVFLSTLVATDNQNQQTGGFPLLAKPVSLEAIERTIHEQTAAAVAR
jgi:CheY-like chemotaxis protein